MGLVSNHQSNETVNQLRVRFNHCNETIGEMGDFIGVTQPTLTQTIIEWVDTNYIGADGDTLDGDLIITGNLTVQGDSFETHTEIVNVEDNTIVVNYGETGAGVTHSDGYAGVQVDRGSAVDYFFVFEENREKFVIGKDGSLQVVATREDAPNDGAFAVWNDTTNQFETSKTTMDQGGSVVEEANATDIAIQMAIALG